MLRCLHRVATKSKQTVGRAMIAFFRRLLIHYGIYRRYPLARVPSLRNAWRIARA